MPFLHQVLGSGAGAADGLPGHRGVDADAKRPACSQLGNKTFCFCGVCSSQHTLRTGLVKPPRSQLGVERILRLTKVKRSFQSTQDAGGGPRSVCGRDARGHMGLQGQLLPWTRQALKVGPRGLCRCWELGAPHGHTNAQGSGTAERRGQLSPAPGAPRLPLPSREAGSQVFKRKIKTGESNQEASVNNN